MEFCSIASGSSGNSIYVGSDKTHLLVDAGISKKRIIEGLNSCDLDLNDINAILVTHEHIDHIKSIGVLSRAKNIPIYCTMGTLNGIKNANLGKVDYSLFNIINSNDEFNIGDIKVNSISSSHDALDSCIYKFSQNNQSVAVATDMGEYNSYTVECLKNLNGILLESNHDIRMLEVGPYPYSLKQRISSSIGHLSNEQAGDLLNKILNNKLEHIYLGHLSKENNIPELAYETVKLEVTLDKTHNYKGSDLNIQVARRDKPMKKVII